MNCVQTNLFMPYLCHVNLLSLIMFKTNQTIGTNTMNKTNKNLDRFLNATEFKQTPKKRTVETINIKIPTSEVLISYALIYSKLNNEGKEMAQKQLNLIGKEYDLMKLQFNFVSPFKNQKGVK